ncbi:MAG: hypothetical protein ACI8RY_001698 [Urechidicola sp.]|jgi:hypothetical protein
MKKYKLLLVSFIFMVIYFVVLVLMDLFEYGFNFDSGDIKRKMLLSVFVGVWIGVMIKFKWIKTNTILSK